MNVFTKAFEKVKDAIDITLRKSQVLAGKAAYIAERESRIEDCKCGLAEHLTNRHWAFHELLETYRDIEKYTREIEEAKRFNDYIFNEIENKK